MIVRDDVDVFVHKNMKKQIYENLFCIILLQFVNKTNCL